MFRMRLVLVLVVGRVVVKVIRIVVKEVKNRMLVLVVISVG